MRFDEDILGAAVMRTIVLSLIAIVLTNPLFAQQRLAFVVGIDAYENVAPLQKATNDARAVSATLDGLGFDVSIQIDPDRRSFSRAISEFSSKIEPGDEVVFYFAGHGIEVSGQNHLLPADAPPARAGDEDFLISESISANRILNMLQNKGARVVLLILDACRNNPFPQNAGRSLGGEQGLARMEPPEGAFILFSAGTGQTALDRLSNSDTNPNSVFTRALLPRLRAPGMSIHELVQDVRRDVRALAATVQHNQFPAYYDQLSGTFTFNPGILPAPKPQAAVAVTPVAPVIAAPNPCDAARADWQVLSTTNSIAALDSFLTVHQNCPIFVAAASERRSVLSAVPSTTIAPQAPVVPVQRNTCEQLWYQRNLIFHRKGYCFQTQRARAAFDTSRCTTQSPSLSPQERASVALLKQAEAANGC